MLENIFLGQRKKKDKMFVIKMSETGSGSGVDLVKKLQHGSDY